MQKVKGFIKIPSDLHILVVESKKQYFQFGCGMAYPISAWFASRGIENTIHDYSADLVADLQSKGYVRPDDGFTPDNVAEFAAFLASYKSPSMSSSDLES